MQRPKDQSAYTPYLDKTTKYKELEMNPIQFNSPDLKTTIKKGGYFGQVGSGNAINYNGFGTLNKGLDLMKREDESAGPRSGVNYFEGSREGERDKLLQSGKLLNPYDPLPLHNQSGHGG